MEFPFWYLAHVPLLTLAQAGLSLLRICLGLFTFAQAKYHFQHTGLQHAELPQL